MSGRTLVLGAVAIMVCVAGGLVGLAQSQFVVPEGLQSLKGPILTTTCGQSPGALMVALLCQGVGLACESLDGLTADQLAANHEAAPIGALFVTTGTSLKGMGAAGVDIDSEVARCTAVIAKAKELGIFVIVGQVEGVGRRTDEMDEQSITSMSPLADLLITRSDVNGDGYFTMLAEEKGIPQIFINDTLDLEVLMPLLFPATG